MLGRILIICLLLPLGWAQGADLAGDQQELAQRYALLKEAALRVAESAEEGSATRAEQIRAAIRKSQELGVEQQLSEVVRLLEQERLAAAITDQEEIAEQLEELLRVMMEDPREAKLAAERKRLERLAAELKELIKRQRDLRNALDGAKLQNRLDQRQEQLADDTAQAAELSEGIESAFEDSPSLKEQIGKAEKAMRSAAKQMGQKQPSDVEPKQQEAQRDLETALREVEESLRQLREEEQQRRLASLAERLKAMHRGEIELRDNTVSLHKKQEPGDREFEVQLITLVERQTRLSSEAERATRLVRADGMSLVFADALLEIEHDMRAITRRMKRKEIAQPTQMLEQGVIDSLAQMIEVVDQSLADLEEQMKMKSQDGGGQPQDSSLIAKLAELRMLKAVQQRLMRQTATWDDIVDQEGGVTEDSKIEIERLADQQLRLGEAANHSASQ